MLSQLMTQSRCHWLKGVESLAVITVTVGGLWYGCSGSVTAQPTEDGGALTVRSDIQEANSETGVVTARGNVQVYYPARQLQGTSVQAQYFSKERRLVMTGNVYVLQEGNSIRAESMTYLVDEGRFIATPRTDEQVESIYLVPESQNNNAALTPASSTISEPGTVVPSSEQNLDTTIDPSVSEPLVPLFSWPEDDETLDNLDHLKNPDTPAQTP